MIYIALCMLAKNRGKTLQVHYRGHISPTEATIFIYCETETTTPSVQCVKQHQQQQQLHICLLSYSTAIFYSVNIDYLCGCRLFKQELMSWIEHFSYVFFSSASLLLTLGKRPKKYRRRRKVVETLFENIRRYMAPSSGSLPTSFHFLVLSMRSYIFCHHCYYTELVNIKIRRIRALCLQKTGTILLIRQALIKYIKK